MAKKKRTVQNKALADLIRISNVTGRDSALVQGGGGNTSAKTDDGKYMYIKASGTALKDMNERVGWRRQRLDEVLRVIQDEDLPKLDETKREDEVVRRLLEACEDDITSGARPSVESHLHGLLDKYVIHLHPMVISSYVNARDGKAQLDKLFRDETYPPLWVSYTDPGFLLARRIAKLTEQYEGQYGRKPSILLLEKHGLFVTAGSADLALRIVNKVLKRCKSKLPPLKARKLKPPAAQDITAAQLAIRRAVFESTGRYLPVKYYTPTASVTAFLGRKDAARLLRTPALNPDELVYANGSALWLDRAEAGTITRKLKALVEKGQKSSAAFVVKGLGLLVAAQEQTAPVVEEITNESLMIRMNALTFGGLKTLSKREQDFINNWESESFRKTLVSGAGEGALKDRIAVVTGAGSGLGRSIAIGLARAGAMVAVADIDTAAAEETIEMMAKEGLAVPTMILPCNVTSESAVEKAFGELLERWGGLDILVNAAGIAPAGPLVDLPVAHLRLALEINLTGYFLMAQQAARIMIQQGMGGNIINLSSKSGLEASKDNTPYNATKAGEIHMARGWAMELGEHGIRVNSVCPGNVFEGSKIWNPKYIRMCAKKYGIQPEEVIPYYVNKTILKREIKGQDIADAVVFLCSDQARTITGQTLVPDSGQVMVR
jgi:NAD(P)-dependent dehydrogenase (short-subunit alcohol dehydrogenase family)/rhamnose utilization protein RhaD (predicted bifunctional aldolase and dehydrogenase)